MNEMIDESCFFEESSFPHAIIDLFYSQATAFMDLLLAKMPIFHIVNPLLYHKFLYPHTRAFPSVCALILSSIAYIKRRPFSILSYVSLESGCRTLQYSDQRGTQDEDKSKIMRFVQGYRAIKHVQPLDRIKNA